jgi:hypothetical protein
MKIKPRYSSSHPSPSSTFLSRSSKHRCTRGFALIATISIMALLVMVGLGMLSLSKVELRSSQNSKAMAEAQANARMALMIAIGELQRHTGSDTRITAPADIVESGAPPLTGVWKSWQGTDHDSTGRPIKPDYTVKTRSESTSGHFLTWLVSGAESGQEPQSPAPSALVFNDDSTVGTIPLLSEGTLGESNPGQVHVTPQPLKDENNLITGSFAWWVSPENQKARLIQPYEPQTDDVAGWVEMGQSNTVPNAGVFGLDSLVDEPFDPSTGLEGLANKGLTLRSTELIVADNPLEPQQSFHNLSTSSVGLLTNTATGGWRKDLSILTEKWDAIYNDYPGGNLPLFRYTPDTGATSQVPKPTTSDYEPAQSNLYPWSEYSLILGYKQPGTYHAASASWTSLQSFATSYKNFSYSSGVVKSPFVWDKIAKMRASSITSDEIYNYKHKQLLHPQIARFQFLVYATAVEDPARLNRTPKRYQLRLMYVPIFTLWNPYNVSLEHEISGLVRGQPQNFLGLGWRRSLPGAMAIVNKVSYPDPDTVPSSAYRLFSNGNFQTLDWPNNYANPYDNQLPSNVTKYGSSSVWKDLRTGACWLPEGTLTFKPGEAKIFSPDWMENGYGYSGATLRLKEGYNPTNIVGRDFNSSSNLLATRSYWFLFRNDRVTQPYRDRAPGNGFSLSFGEGSSHFGGTSEHPSAIGDEFHNITSLASESEGDMYWPPDDLDEVGYSVGELEGQWIPVFSASFGPRMTIGTGPGTEQNRPTKGTVQSNPLAGMVLSDPASGIAKDHPANNTFDFAYHSLSIGSTTTPNLSDSNGFIGTGYQSGDGLKRLIMAEIPLRPMASLVELQGWNPRGQNPYPPFQMNLIGNSDGTPLIPNDDIVPPTLHPSGVDYNLQHDDAYCANHLLFDDWFVSSIAPQPTVLGGDIDKDIDTVYKEYLMGVSELTNRAYRPIGEDQKLSSSDADDRADEIINSPDGDGWLKVASRFEVDGMFNVNSTSIDAWKAVLGHAKNREVIARYGENGIDSTAATNGHPVSRGAVAFDAEAGTQSVVAGHFEDATEYTGFRSLDDDQIVDLAKKIVDQVRLRGPFLSLSEFVNRQLSTEDDRALAGVVQTAINNLTADPMAKLRDPGNMLSDTTMPAADPKLVGADYQFAEAAEGSSAYGAPGWIRQADILRPIAPIMSARDDTFTIRAYGETLDPSGKVLAKAWCEAVVQRTRNFTETSDPADSIDSPVSPTNTEFGRKYEIMSFRWLNKHEV